MSPSAMRPQKLNKKGDKSDKEQPKAEADVNMGEGEPPAQQQRGRRGGARKNKQISKHMQSNKELYTVILKSILQLQQGHRTICAAIFDVFILPTTSDEVVAALAEGKLYNELAHSDKAEEKALTTVPPHLYIFSSILKALLARGPSIGAKNHAELTSFENKFEAEELADRLEQVRVCRVDRTFRSDQKKLTLHVEHSSCRAALLLALKQTEGAMHKQGRAPAGGMERELQHWLASFLADE